MSKAKGRKATPKMKKMKSLNERLHDIKNPDIKRLSRVAGVLIIKLEVYNTVRGVIHDISAELVRKSLIFTHYSNRKTLNNNDVISALATNHNDISVGKLIKGMKGKSIKKTKRTPPTNGKKPPRKRPGTVARMEIRKFQKASGFLMLQITPFRNLIIALAKELTIDKNEKIRFQAKAMNTLQFYIESVIIRIIQNAYMISVESNKRKSLFSKDIIIANKIQENMIRIR